MNNELNHCDTCQFWDREHTAETPGYHRCLHPRNNGDDEHEGGFTGGDGGEPFNAGDFASGPKFGCIYHSRVPWPCPGPL